MSDTRTTVTFNGVSLTSLYIVSGWHTPLLARDFDTVDIAGLDGQRFLGATLSPRTITLSLTVRGRTLEEREEAARVLAATLAVDEPKPLSASFMDGRYYLAIPKSDSSLTRFVNADTFEVQFLVPDPVAYGDLVTIDVPDVSRYYYFDVGGNYPTLPTVVMDLTRQSTSGDSYLTFSVGNTGDSRMTHIDLTDVMGPSETSAHLTVDSQARRYTSGNTLKMLPLAGDWPVMGPGSSSYGAFGRLNCSGSGTITYRERWL